MTRRISLVLAIALAASLSACAGPKMTDVMSNKPPVELRAMQTRAFDTTDRNKTVRTIIATLQDLGYTVTKVEPAAGTVSASKLGALSLSAMAYPRGASQTTVRVNAMLLMPGLKNTQVDDPQFYQQLFFEPLSKAMFLTALQVEDDPGAPAAPAGIPLAAPTQTKTN